MNERAPGEVDALANGDQDPSIIIERIKDNLRARQQAPDYRGFLTEEEADYLFGAVETAEEYREEAEARAEAADDRVLDVRRELEDAQEELDDAGTTISELKERIKELETQLEGANS